jgi:AMP nucleosidase
MQHLPPFIAPSEHHDADSALAQIQHIYQHSVNHLRQAMREFVAGADMAGTSITSASS